MFDPNINRESFPFLHCLKAGESAGSLLSSLSSCQRRNLAWKQENYGHIPFLFCSEKKKLEELAAFRNKAYAQAIYLLLYLHEIAALPLSALWQAMTKILPAACISHHP